MKVESYVSLITRSTFLHGRRFKPRHGPPEEDEPVAHPVKKVIGLRCAVAVVRHIFKSG
jgi:hypothetical protein